MSPTDRDRLLWCVGHSAQFHFSETPTPGVVLTRITNGEGGYLAAVELSAYPSREDAIIGVIDKAMHQWLCEVVVGRNATK